jgi:hypothetical protein
MWKESKARKRREKREFSNRKTHDLNTYGVHIRQDGKRIDPMSTVNITDTTNVNILDNSSDSSSDILDTLNTHTLSQKTSLHTLDI